MSEWERLSLTAIILSDGDVEGVGEPLFCPLDRGRVSVLVVNRAAKVEFGLGRLAGVDLVEDAPQGDLRERRLVEGGGVREQGDLRRIPAPGEDLSVRRRREERKQWEEEERGGGHGEKEKRGMVVEY